VTADVTPTISALRRRGDEIVEHLLRRNESRWESLSGADRERLEAVAQEVAARLIQAPTLRLESVQGESSLRYARALQDLFGLRHEDLRQAAP
jgi:glutamyl-tRNA reductase